MCREKSLQLESWRYGIPLHHYSLIPKYTCDLHLTTNTHAGVENLHLNVKAESESPVFEPSRGLKNAMSIVHRNGRLSYVRLSSDGELWLQN